MTNIEKKIENLIKWFKENRNKEGNTINDAFYNLEVKVFEGMGFGISYKGETSKYYKEGSKTFLIIPYHLILSRENIENKTDFIQQLNFNSSAIHQKFSLGLNNKDQVLKEHEVDEVLLTMFLAYYKNNSEKEHYWKPYTDFLNELPNQGYFSYMISDYSQTVLPLISLIHKGVNEKMKNELPNPNESDEMYKWAYTVIKTRASKPQENNESTHTFLLPFLDFFNTMAGQKKEEMFVINYYKDTNERYFAYLAPEGNKPLEVKKNEQVFIYYGEDLKHYGITELELPTQVQIPPK